MVEYHDLKHPRKISDITDGEIALFASSDGGTTWYPVKSDDDGQLAVVSGLVPKAYDHIDLSYTGDTLTSVVYKTGGAAGSTVATLTLSYTGSTLDSVTRTDPP